MKTVRNVAFFVLLLILLPPAARSQTSSLRNDPIFQAARKAQQDGRIADAEKILNDRIHAIEQTQPNSPELVPYLNLLAMIANIKRQSSDAHAIYQRMLEIDRSAFGPGYSRRPRINGLIAPTLRPPY